MVLLSWFIMLLRLIIFIVISEADKECRQQLETLLWCGYSRRQIGRVRRQLMCMKSSAGLRQYRLQIADDTTAIRLDPKYQPACINRAWAQYDKLGNHQLAKRDRRMTAKLS